VAAPKPRFERGGPGPCPNLYPASRLQKLRRRPRRIARQGPAEEAKRRMPESRRVIPCAPHPDGRPSTTLPGLPAGAFTSDRQLARSTTHRSASRRRELGPRGLLGGAERCASRPSALGTGQADRQRGARRGRSLEQSTPTLRRSGSSPEAVAGARAVASYNQHTMGGDLLFSRDRLGGGGRRDAWSHMKRRAR